MQKINCNVKLLEKNIHNFQYIFSIQQKCKHFTPMFAIVLMRIYRLNINFAASKSELY